jgi:hypothetical protein
MTGVYYNTQGICQMIDFSFNPKMLLGQYLITFKAKLHIHNLKY